MLRARKSVNNAVFDLPTVTGVRAVVFEALGDRRIASSSNAWTIHRCQLSFEVGDLRTQFTFTHASVP
jgi:hypothetical protein